MSSFTPFIEFILRIIIAALDDLLATRTGPLSGKDRMTLFLARGTKSFTRKK